MTHAVSYQSILITNSECITVVLCCSVVPGECTGLKDLRDPWDLRLMLGSLHVSVVCAYRIVPRPLFHGSCCERVRATEGGDGSVGARGCPRIKDLRFILFELAPSVKTARSDLVSCKRKLRVNSGTYNRMAEISYRFLLLRLTVDVNEAGLRVCFVPFSALGPLPSSSSPHFIALISLGSLS